jgi:hypothetical protein
MQAEHFAEYEDRSPDRGAYADLTNFHAGSMISPGFLSSGGRRSAAEGGSPNSNRTFARDPAPKRPLAACAGPQVEAECASLSRPALALIGRAVNGVGEDFMAHPPIDRSTRQGQRK